MLKKVLLLLASIILIGFTACSGGSSSDAGSPESGQNTLSGTVATGAGASASIILVGANGNTIYGNSSANGYYSVDVSSLTKPIMMKAVLDRDGSTLYSFAATNSKTVNVTPLTSYVVDQAAVATGVLGGASQLFTRFEEDNAPADTQDQIGVSIVNLDNAIESVMQTNGTIGFDHFGGDFEANHDGYDAVLDDLDIEVYEDDIIIRVDDSVLDTLNYTIDVSEINASGIVYNITNSTKIAGVNITMVDSAGHTLSAVTDVNGSFTITVDTMRVYDITIAATGYETQFVPNVPSFVFSETSVGEIPMFPVGESGTTTLSGSIINGRTSNTGIDGATLTFRDGYGDRTSSSVYTTTTDAYGDYSIDLPIGVYMVEISHDDYNRVFVDIEVFGTTSQSDFSMLADISSSETSSTEFFATITLNWDEDPSDLDSHLTGPIPNSSERFHMAYYNREIDADGSGFNIEEGEEEGLHAPSLVAEFEDEYDNIIPCSNGEIATLDRDRTSASSGLLPETTTMCNVENGGLYKYYVHHYSGNGTMSEGNAVVTVTTKTGISRTYTSPSTGSIGDDDIWHVFNIDSDGNIYPINMMIGNDDSHSTLFAAPSRNTTTKFSADTNLLDNLPAK